ncbi:hypothetical protein ACQ27_gp004 [Klebsiella phage K64-1]|uniref:hypothetical protein n=1 Tax=Klebsiella phage K64-1 TaxID=1439894 RepID=UPI00248BCC18|nr:hypothetical protein ACQ27_gp004 [Klebsiella phage K64-1]
MNLNTSEMFFNDVKSKFLKNDGSGFDEKIKEVVLRWKNSPVLNNICPRWSCQSHEYDDFNTYYYIIFCTQNDGAEFLYNKVLKKLIELSAKYGVMDNCWEYKVIQLMNTIDNNHTPFEPHVEIACRVFGDYNKICILEKVWLELLEGIEKEYGQ